MRRDPGDMVGLRRRLFVDRLAPRGCRSEQT
jgi:hypothetical protein